MIVILFLLSFYRILIPTVVIIPSPKWGKGQGWGYQNSFCGYTPSSTSCCIFATTDGRSAE